MHNYWIHKIYIFGYSIKHSELLVARKICKNQFAVKTACSVWRHVRSLHFHVKYWVYANENHVIKFLQLPSWELLWNRQIIELILKDLHAMVGLECLHSWKSTEKFIRLQFIEKNKFWLQFALFEIKASSISSANRPSIAVYNRAISSNRN